MVVSSSQIREKVAKGAVEDAADLLGRPYSLCGVVIAGEKRGRNLGYPTANIQTDYTLIPETGVYAIRARVDYGDWKDGIANLGFNPTFQGQKFKIEVHLFDFSDDIYGCDIEVGFLYRIREERRFPSARALIEQLSLDIQKVKSLLAL